MSALQAICLIDGKQTVHAKPGAHGARVTVEKRSDVDGCGKTAAEEAGGLRAAEMTRRIARGDRDALAVFYQRWFDTMYHEAARATGRDETFCLDVVQDVMLRVIQKMSPMQSDAQVAGWLRKVVRSCAYDRLRSDVARSRREDARCRSMHGSGEPCAAPGADRDEERLEWLRRQLDSMDEALRRPLLLRVLSGWTLAQIGTALGLSPGAVDGRVHRAMKKLRENAEQSDD